VTVVATSAATAARNPANLRVTAKTQTTTSLAWDSLGSSDYVLHFWKDGNWVKVTLPRTQRYGVVDGTNTFVLRAVDSAGNVSAPSNSYPIELNIC
jgi:hypothetical protein